MANHITTAIYSIALLVLIIQALLTGSLPEDNVIDKDKALSFLENQFVPEAGLLRCAVISSPDNETIYVANDNILAVYALKILGSPIAGMVNSSLAKYGSRIYDNRVAVLLGRTIPDEFYHTDKILLDYIYSRKFMTNFSVILEENNHNKPFTNWMNYTDLVAYKVLNEILKNKIDHAKEYFNHLISMWDGYGFHDAAYKNSYEVYKLALYVYAYRSLLSQYPDLANNEEALRIFRKALEIIREAQDPKYGGIHTHYRVVGNETIIEGDMNTETTSIVVISLYSKPLRPLVANNLSKIRDESLSIKEIYTFMFAFPVFFVIAVIIYLFIRRNKICERKR